MLFPLSNFSLGTVCLLTQLFYFCSNMQVFDVKLNCHIWLIEITIISFNSESVICIIVMRAICIIIVLIGGKLCLWIDMTTSRAYIYMLFRFIFRFSVHIFYIWLFIKKWPAIISRHVHNKCSIHYYKNSKVMVIGEC